MINHKARLNELQRSLKKKKLGALLVTNFYNIRYLTGFVGLTPQEREAYVLLTNNQIYFFTDGRYIEQAKRLLPVSPSYFARKKVLPKAGSYSDPGSEMRIVEIKPGERIAKLIAKSVSDLKLRKLGIEKNDLRVSEYDEFKKYLNKDARACQLIYTENLIEDLRVVKDPLELEKIEKAAGITDKCFDHLLKFLKPGLTEKEVADETERFIRREGAVDLSFDPIVANGPNSSLPHYLTGNCKLKNDSLVLIDFGAKVDGYCSDMTRVVFLGKPAEEQKRIYQIVATAQKKALDTLLYYSKVIESSTKKKIRARNVDKTARGYLKNQGFEFAHGLGHGVGLSEHEAPRLEPTSRDILKQGVVFSIEPGIYLPGKFGIRIEDLIVLEKEGPRVLTKSTKELITIH